MYDPALRLGQPGDATSGLVWRHPKSQPLFHKTNHREIIKKGVKGYTAHFIFLLIFALRCHSFTKTSITLVILLLTIAVHYIVSAIP